MQFGGRELTCGLEFRLSCGPLFVTRKGGTIVIFHGGFQRWRAVRIATIEVRWKSNWQVSFRGEAFAREVFGNLTSEDTTYLAFKETTGHMIIGDSENADVRVAQKRRGSYVIEVHDKKHGWEALLAGQRTRDGDVTVEISCNGAKVISSPSNHETWTEGVYSIGGFVRHKWGDWIVQSSDTLPLPAAVASLCCVAFHNSVLGDLLMSDHPIG